MTDAKHSPTQPALRCLICGYEGTNHTARTIECWERRLDHDQETIRLLAEALMAAEWLEPQVWGIRTLAGCPVCLNGKPIHEPDCIVAEALARVKEPQG